MTASDCEHRDDALDAQDAETDEELDGDVEEEHERDVGSHLRDVEAGAGCTEIWEHLSENRDE